MRRALPLAGLLAGLLAAVAGAQHAPTPAPTPTPAPYGDTPAAYQPYSRFAEPYERFFRTPQPYRGWGRNIPEPEAVASVRIGFLGPIEHTVSVATGGPSHEEGLGRQMLAGAQLAICDANAAGGYRGTGTPFELVVRNDNGLWGASGSEVVHLALVDRVWAMVGTIDSANSHIAIRVALKLELSVVNTGDTDPTFVETAIPWVFRVITDDRQMAYLLADYLFGRLGVTRVATLRANNRYGRVSLDELRDAATRAGRPFLAELTYRVGESDFRPLLTRLRGLDPEAIVTWGDARESALILRQMRELGMDQWLVGSDRMVSREFLDRAGDAGGRVVAACPWNPDRNDPRLARFVKAYTDRFGEPPGTYAAHAYDGVTLLIQAIQRAGLNRARIRDELAAVERFDGVTGPKVFDAVASNRSEPLLALLRDGRFVFLDRAAALGE